MITAFVHSLNIGSPKKEVFADKEVITGICKKPVNSAVALSKNGFSGDDAHNKKHHGGVDKAVCFYCLDHYPYWAEKLGITMPEAAFGENITLHGATEEKVCIGDIYQLGSATVEVSQPRQPCKVLAARFARPDLPKMVVQTGYTGWYSRVLVEGLVRQGDSMTLVAKGPQQLSIAYANQIFHHDRQNRSGLESILALPALSESWRHSVQELLARCP